MITVEPSRFTTQVPCLSEHHGQLVTGLLEFSRAGVCELNFKSISATQPTPPIFFRSWNTVQQEKYQLFSPWIRHQNKETNQPHGCVSPAPYLLAWYWSWWAAPSVYLPTPRTLRAQQAAPPSVLCKLIIAQLKLSHPVWPVPHKALRSRSSPAPISLLLSSYVWLSVLQMLYLVLGHNARLVCNTDSSGATGDIRRRSNVHRIFHLVCIRSFRRVVGRSLARD